MFRGSKFAFAKECEDVEGLEKSVFEEKNLWEHTDGDLECGGLPRSPLTKTRVVAL